MICEWRDFSVILHHCCEKIFWDGGVEGWSKKSFINKLFPNRPKNYMEYFFFIMYHQNACSRGISGTVAE